MYIYIEREIYILIFGRGGLGMASGRDTTGCTSRGGKGGVPWRGSAAVLGHRFRTGGTVRQ